MPTNRKVAIGSAFLTLALAVLPVMANMDWTSTAGIIVGIIAVLGIVNRWLAGWSNYETAEVAQRAAALQAVAAGREAPGLTEGVKAEGFEPVK